MRLEPEPLIFALLLAGTAALLFSIAVGQTLLALAAAAWLVWRPRRPRLPSFAVPLFVFAAATLVSLALSPQPDLNWAARKTVLLAMVPLAATFVTTARRARLACMTLLSVACIASAYGLIQFALAYTRFRASRDLADDPMILARITGFMGHWQTFSGEQLLVWCFSLAAIAALGRRWLVPLTIVGAALILSFTRGVWAGAIGAVAVLATLAPRRLLLPVLLPLLVIALAASGLIFHRINASLEQNGQFMPDTGRIELWKAGFEMIREHPWFGVGPERIAAEFPKHYRGTSLQDIYYGHLENDFLQIAAERGLICFAIFLWLLLAIYAGLLRVRRMTDDNLRWLPLAAIAALTGFVISGFFEYNFGDSEVQLLLLFLVSMPFGVLDERDDKKTG
jgi:putative inorganic carbon (hco3(-)) transporter